MRRDIKEMILSETPLTIDTKGSVNICDYDPKELSKKYGSPLYIYSELEIVKRIESLKQSFQYYDGVFEPYYSLKANNNIHVIKTMKEHGLGAEVASLNELKLALKLDFKKNRIIYHGNARSKTDLLFAIKNDILIIADSYEEILMINKFSSENNKNVRMGLRLNLDLRNSYIWKGSAINNKFGISLNYINDIITLLLNNSNIVFESLHLHIGSQIANENDYTKPLEKYLSVLRKFISNGLYPNSINLGGGYPEKYKYSDTECTVDKEYLIPSFNLLELGKYISTKLNVEFKEYQLKPKLIIEIGRYLTASCGILLTKICNIKKTNTVTWAGLDGGCNLLPDTWIYNWYFECVSLNYFIEKKANWELYNLAGPLCDSGDVLKVGVLLPKLQAEDILLFLKTGAYQEVQKNNFNILDSSKAIFINNNNQIL